MAADGQYIKLHSSAVRCRPCDFVELWALMDAVAAPGTEGTVVATVSATPSNTCRVLNKSATECVTLLRLVRDDVVRRTGLPADRLRHTIVFSPSGDVDAVEPTDAAAAHFSYTFNAPGSSPRHLFVVAKDVEWPAVLHTGDLLEYRGSLTGKFTFKIWTSAAHCNGQRVVVTVSAPL